MPEFLNPGMLWWLAAALPAITILYFLRLRRETKRVSSTLLWRRSVHDLRVNAPIQMIRRNLLLLLQLLAITAALLALARPFTHITEPRGRTAALVIDASASMGTTDAPGGKTRLDAAKDEALRILDAMGQDPSATRHDRLSIIVAADQPYTASALTHDTAHLRRAIESITLRQTHADLPAAIQMALAISTEAPPPAEDGETGIAPPPLLPLILIGDGVSGGIPEALTAYLAPPTEAESIWEGSRYLRVGQTTSDNLALVSADLRDDPGGIAGRQIFLRVENMSHIPRQATLTVELNGIFHDRKRITIPPRPPVHEAPAGEEPTSPSALPPPPPPGQAGVDFRIPAEARGRVVVRLEPADGLPDSMAADNVVHAVLHPPEPIRCLLVSAEGHYFLEHAIRQLADTVTLATITPSAYEAQAERDGEVRMPDGSPVELTLFDRYAPPQTPDGGSFFIGTVPRDLPDIEDQGLLYVPRILDWNRNHPILRFVSGLDALLIYRTRHLELGGGWVPLLEAEGVSLAREEDLRDEAVLRAAPVLEVPLLASHTAEERRVAILAFDIWDTRDWVMRVSFPLLIRNTIHWLARPGGHQQRPVHQTGETLRAEFPRDTGDVRVTRPDGSVTNAMTTGTRQVYVSDTGEAGFYTLRGDDGTVREFGYSLLRAQESDNAAREAVTFGQRRFEAARGEQRRSRDLWPYAVMLVLAFLLLEWYVFNKRILG